MVTYKSRIFKRKQDLVQTAENIFVFLQTQYSEAEAYDVRTETEFVQGENITSGTD